MRVNPFSPTGKVPLLWIWYKWYLDNAKAERTTNGRDITSFKNVLHRQSLILGFISNHVDTFVGWDMVQSTEAFFVWRERISESTIYTSKRHGVTHELHQKEMEFLLIRWRLGKRKQCISNWEFEFRLTAGDLLNHLIRVRVRKLIIWSYVEGPRISINSGTPPPPPSPVDRWIIRAWVKRQTQVLQSKILTCASPYSTHTCIVVVMLNLHLSIFVISCCNAIIKWLLNERPSSLCSLTAILNTRGGEFILFIYLFTEEDIRTFQKIKIRKHIVLPLS